MRNNSRSRWLWALILLLAGVLLFFALRGVDWREVLETLQKTQPGYLIVGWLVSTGAYGLRALRWRVLINEEKRIAPLTVFWATMAGYLGNSFLPARAGELIRAIALGYRTGISKSFLLATALTERILDAVALVLIGFATAAWIGELFGWPVAAARSLGVVGLVSLGLLVGLPRWEYGLRRMLTWLPLPGPLGTRIPGMLGQVLQGMRSFQRPAPALAFAGLTAVIWLTDAMGALLVARALNLSLVLPQTLFLLAALGLSSALPSTPGYVGIYQFVAVIVLMPFGLSRGQALLYVTLLQVGTYLVVVLWGCVGLWQLGVPRAEMSLIREERM